MVPAPGPVGLDSCVLSRGPKIDQDMTATSAPSVLSLRRAAGPNFPVPERAQTRGLRRQAGPVFPLECPLPLVWG